MAVRRSGREPSVPDRGSLMDLIGNAATEMFLNSWVTRYNDISFKCNGVYHGIVETIQSKGAATVVIGEKKRGIPLKWDDDWQGEDVVFAKVLLMVDRLRPSIDQSEYDKDTILRDKIREGEVLFVVVEECKKSPDNIYRYFASSAFKIESLGNKVCFGDSVMLKIRDPLRGVVESYVSPDVGIIRFGTYNGCISKALFTSISFQSGSKNAGGGLPLKSLAPVNTLVYVEVTKWLGKSRAQEWEKLLHKDGILFKATLVWPKDTRRPDRIGGEGEKLGETHRGARDKKDRGFEKSVEDMPLRFNPGPREVTYLLTNIQAYYGVVEIIPSSTVAVLCTAHRKGLPLTWMDNWFAKDVSYERILVISDHVRPSKNAPESVKGTAMKTILHEGGRVMVVVEPTAKSPDKCYKWFAKTCWKAEDEAKGAPQIPSNLLPGHLCGEVESVISHDVGIISFCTHHGFPAKAFFSHGNFYKKGKKILSHIPIGSEVRTGTKVNLIADKWYQGRNPKEMEESAREKEVQFKAVMAWPMGSPRPNENDAAANRGGEERGYQKNIPTSSRSEQSERNPSTAAKGGRGKFSGNANPGGRGGRGGRPFAGNRGSGRGVGKKGGRGGNTRGMQPKNQSKGDDTRSCGDWVDLYENLSELSDYLGAASLSTENLSTVSSGHSESRFPCGAVSNVACFDSSSRSEQKCSMGRDETREFGFGIPSSRPLPTKKLEVPQHDVTQSGTLISIDGTWGLMQVDGEDVHDFQSDSVYMYGLKLEGVPLHQLFHQGQSFNVHMEGGKMVAVEYGAPQPPTHVRKAIAMYCENNSISEDVKYKLETILKTFGV